MKPLTLLLSLSVGVFINFYDFPTDSIKYQNDRNVQKIERRNQRKMKTTNTNKSTRGNVNGTHDTPAQYRKGTDPTQRPH